MQASSGNIDPIAGTIRRLFGLFVLRECDRQTSSQDQMSCQPTVLVWAVISIPAARALSVITCIQDN
jgi:hypothetical protein